MSDKNDDQWCDSQEDDQPRFYFVQADVSELEKLEDEK